MHKVFLSLSWALVSMAIWGCVTAIIIYAPIESGWGIAGLIIAAIVATPNLRISADKKDKEGPSDVGN